MLHESRSIVWDGGECHQSHGNNLKDSDGARLSKRMKKKYFMYAAIMHSLTSMTEAQRKKTDFQHI